MALVNGGYFHYTDMNKFLKIFSETTGHFLKHFLRNVPWLTLFKNCLQHFDLSVNMALVNLGYFLCKDIRNSCKFFSASDKKKIATVLFKIQVSDAGPSWPSCLILNKTMKCKGCNALFCILQFF